MGFVALTLRTSGDGLTASQAIQLLATKIGEVLLVLGALYLAGIVTLTRLRRRLRMQAQPGTATAAAGREASPVAKVSSAASAAGAPGTLARPRPGGPFRDAPRGVQADAARRADQGRHRRGGPPALPRDRLRGHDDAGDRARGRRLTGNAYYYFGSKDELIQEFYLRNHAEHAAACRQLLDTEREFTSRLRGTLRALIDVLSPYQSFAAAFYKNAAEPTSPLSPFTRNPARREMPRSPCTARSPTIVGEDRPELRAELPELLWLYSLGIVLFWVHDTSPACAKTYRLIDATVPLADHLLSLARVPVLRGTMREFVAIIGEIRE